MHCFPHLCDYLMQLLPAVSAAFSMLVLTVFLRPVALKLLSHSFPPLFSVKQSKTPGMFLAFSDACSAISQHACGSDLSLASTLRSKMESSKSAFPLHFPSLDSAAVPLVQSWNWVRAWPLSCCLKKENQKNVLCGAAHFLFGLHFLLDNVASKHASFFFVGVNVQFDQPHVTIMLSW